MHHSIKATLRIMTSMILVATGAVALSTGAQADGTDTAANSTGKTAAQAINIGTSDSDATAPASGPRGKCVSTNGAKACFARKGDHIWVKDTKADGHHAKGYILRLPSLDRPGGGQNPPPPYFSRICSNYKGAGKWKHCNFNVPDGHRAQFSVGRYEKKNPLNFNDRWVRS